VTHHKTFDLGAFTVADGVILVSDQANGTTSFAETLLAHDWIPETHHLEWHRRELFKGHERHRT